MLHFFDGVLGGCLSGGRGKVSPVWRFFAMLGGRFLRMAPNKNSDFLRKLFHYTFRNYGNRNDHQTFRLSQTQH